MNISLLLFIVFTFFIGIFYRDFCYISVPAPIPGGKLFVSELFILSLILLKSKELLTFKWNKEIKFLFPFQLFSLGALAYSNWDISFLVLREMAAAYYSFFFVITLLVVQNQRQSEKVIKTILIASVFSVLLIIIRFCLGVSYSTSTFGALRYGNYETVGILVLLSWLMIKPFKKWPKKYWVIFLITIFVAVFLINHRSTTIAMIITFLAMLLIKNHFSIKKIVPSLIVLIGVFVFITIILSLFNPIIFEKSIERLTTITTPKEEVNASWRLATWGLAIFDLNKIEFFIGKGWGHQLPIMYFNNKVYGKKGEIRGFHNSFLFLIYHIGSIGLFLLLCFILHTYRISYKNVRNKSLLTQNKVSALIAANLGIIAFGFFNVVLEGPYMSFFFWVTLALMHIIAKVESDINYNSK